jgi:hypothetical protein
MNIFNGLNHIREKSGHKETDINKLKERLSYWLGTYWVDFDHVYMKPRLVHNWPDVKDQNDELSTRILKLADQYKEELKQREKNKNEDKEDDINNFSRFAPLKNINSNEIKKNIVGEEENLGVTSIY